MANDENAELLLDCEKESDRSADWLENILKVASIEICTEEADYAKGSPSL
jgi:hypothetical protein